MRRRGPNILGQIFKSIWESNSGKIHISSGGYRFNPTKALMDKTFSHNPAVKAYFMKPKPDADGKMMVLISQRSVNCPNPEIYEGVYPKLKVGEVFVGSIPYSVCRKCEFHAPRIPRKYPFPRCLFKAKSQPGISAAIETTKIFNKAVQDTMDIFR